MQQKSKFVVNQNRFFDLRNLKRDSGEYNLTDSKNIISFVTPLPTIPVNNIVASITTSIYLNSGCSFLSFLYIPAFISLANCKAFFSVSLDLATIDLNRLIVKFRHYKEERHKNIYLLKIKREIRNSNLTSLLLRQKIKHIKDNILIFLEVIEFVKQHDNCLIFMSVDNNQFNAFVRLLEIIPHNEHITIVKESDLKRKSVEHQLSLIIDTMLNLERLSK